MIDRRNDRAARGVVPRAARPARPRSSSNASTLWAIAFRRVVFAQVRISLLNTLFTAIYLIVALPLFGVDLPFRKRSSP
jgi:hypothetical protein